MPYKTTQSLLCLPLLALALLTACATGVTHAPVAFTPVATPEVRPRFTLTKQTEVRLDTGYTRNLNAGSQWRRIGAIAQGDVYQPHNAIFTLEGKHIHEAYLVIASGQLTGFYLPVERGFSPLAQPVALHLSSTP